MQGDQQPPNYPEYPQQPYSQSLPPQKPVKKSWYKRPIQMPIWLFILVLFIALVAGSLIRGGDNTISNADTSPTVVANSTPTSTTPTPPPTPTPTPKPLTWQTTHTYSGNGDGKTETFTINGNDWKLEWSCNPSSNYIGEYNVIVDVDNSDTTPMDPGAINTICKSGNTSGVTEEHQGGSFYLDVRSEDAWTMTIQELK